MNKTNVALKVPKTAEVVARSLRERIIRDGLAPGAPLPSELELRTQYKISRPTVREALRILEVQNVVTIARGAHGGARVSLPDREMVAEHGAVYLQAHRTPVSDLHEARTLLEPQVLGWLARNIQQKGIRALRESVEEHRRAASDPTAFVNADDHFHELLVELCGNRTLSVFLHMIHELLHSDMGLHLRLAATRRSPRSFEADIAAKERLVELLAKRDADGAQEHWFKHLEAQRKLLTASGLANSLVAMP